MADEMSQTLIFDCSSSTQLLIDYLKQGANLKKVLPAVD